MSIFGLCFRLVSSVSSLSLSIVVYSGFHRHNQVSSGLEERSIEGPRAILALHTASSCLFADIYPRAHMNHRQLPCRHSHTPLVDWNVGRT
jgi:hypothetical protein